MIYLINWTFIPMWIVSGLLGLLAGYLLWARWKSKYQTCLEEVGSWKNENEKLEAKLKECNHLRAVLEGDISIANGRVKEMKAKLEAATADDDIKKGGAAKASSEKTRAGKGKSDKGHPDKSNVSKENATKKDNAPKEESDSSNSNLGDVASGFAAGIVSAEGDSGSSASGISSSSDSKPKNKADASEKGGFSKFKDNDLKIVEGIGPKIAELLNNAGVSTWASLAETEVSKVQEILDSAGSKFKLANPGSWPQQAGLAAAGKWTELQKLQDKLDRGA